MEKIPRGIMKVELTPEAAERFTAFPERNGMSQKSVSTRLAMWFCQQSQEVQQAILQDFANGKADELELIKKILNAIAK